jgi:YidC/Oxa1 family membrane protein insertase
MIDKNTIIGFALIAVILISFGIYNSPSEAEKKAQQKTIDSLAQVQNNKEEQLKITNAQNVKSEVVLNDSAKLIQNTQKYGMLAGAATGTINYLTLENENLKIKLSNKGARIVSVVLKNYKTHDKKSLELFNEDSSNFNINLNVENRVVNTSDLYFVATGDNKIVSGGDSAMACFKLPAADGKYLEVVYSLKGNDFIVRSKLNLVGMQDLISAQTKELSLNWSLNLPSHEKNITGERAATTVYFKSKEEGVDYLSETSDEKVNTPANIKWVSFKSQFFASSLIADKDFEKPLSVETKTEAGSIKYIKTTSAQITLPYNHSPAESIGYSFYFGPNHYNTLKKYELDLEKQVPLGWGIFGWVNRFIVIPVFHFFGGFGWNYGIVILCLTLVFKTLLFPLTYKAYLSAAKMRVLKPEMDEINKKYENGDPLKKQQETMGLYRSAGVNPMGGCLPMLLQLPILIALFRFFPSSIELRQQAFLWADDLSSFDSVMNLGFNIPFYGDHVSLFALLMTISTVIYTYTNSQMTPTDPNMAAMKWMMYLMPVIFLGVMNSSSSGLSYYYFIANLITIAQQLVMRRFVDENAIYAKIQENKAKPVTKSKFQQRLEEMAKQRGVQLPNQTKK